jgi:hypothetical protein
MRSRRDSLRSPEMGRRRGRSHRSQRRRLRVARARRGISSPPIDWWNCLPGMEAESTRKAQLAVSKRLRRLNQGNWALGMEARGKRGEPSGMGCNQTRPERWRVGQDSGIQRVMCTPRHHMTIGPTTEQNPKRTKITVVERRCYTHPNITSTTTAM